MFHPFLVNGLSMTFASEVRSHWPSIPPSGPAFVDRFANVLIRGASKAINELQNNGNSAFPRSEENLTSTSFNDLLSNSRWTSNSHDRRGDRKSALIAERLRFRVNFGAGFLELLGFLFQANLQHFVVGNFLLRRELGHVLRDFHRTAPYDKAT